MSLFILGTLACGALLNSQRTSRLVVAVGLATIIALSGLLAPKRLILVTVGWLVVMGTVRRVLAGVIPEAVGGDPLLLVGPAAVFGLALLAPVLGKSYPRTKLADAVLLMTAVCMLSVFNPRQGGLLVGFGGVLLVVVPMIAFWAGRSFLDDRNFTALLKLLAIAATVAAVYGLFQVWVGFPSWDAAWIRDRGYTSLEVGGYIRPFASFASVNEYATFLGIGLVAWVCLALTRGKWPLIRVAAAATVAGAMWLVSVRAVIVLAVVALGTCVAANRRMPPWRGICLAVVLVAALPWVVARVVSEPGGASAQDRFIAHQIGGLTDPFGEQSTLPTHIKQVVDGIKSASTNPAGSGVGAVTIAADRLGGRNAGTENDPGDAAIIAGAPGLVTYFLLMTLGLTRAYRLASDRRDPLALAALAIIILTFLHWLTGGQYSVAVIAWLALGWIDRSAAQRSIDVSNSLNPVGISKS